MIKNEKFLTISIDFVKMINSVLSIRNDSIELFYELIDIIADTLTMIDYNSEESHLYFTQVLQTFLFINLIEKHYLILEEVIKKLNNENNYQNIKERKKYGKKKELLKLPMKVINLNIIHFQCFLTLRESFTWDM